MTRRLSLMALAGLLLSAAAHAATPLQIYFIDVEGGQATLFVTPAGESVLVDAGFPGDPALTASVFGPSGSTAGDGRDPKRVLAAAKDAGVARIDYLIVTHFHADHVGGVAELAGLIPIKTFVDHGAPAPNTDDNVPGSMAIYEKYAAVRAKGRHLVPKPGDSLPLEGVELRFLSGGGAVLASALPGAGQPNAACTGTGLPAQEKIENPNSVGFRLAFGRFRFVDVGDLSGPPLHALTCPVNLVGAAEVYLIAHHGGGDAADPAIFKALGPLAVVTNNGARKGGQPPTLATVQQLGIDGWQLHRSTNEGAANAPDDRLANLDESTSAWIKVSANEDGSFTVTNGRTGFVKSYRR